MASVPAPRETTPATKSIGVAFGSFYFTPDVSETTTLTQRQFFDTITRCLRGIDGVSEVRTDLGVLQSDQTVEFEPIKHDPTTRYLGPHLQLAHIGFSLTIPEAVQREEDRFARGDISENFRVEMGYGWGVPVSCVAVTGAAVPDPTAASRTVSLYLAKRVEQSAEPVAFGYIAPIFAHADFVLIPDKPLAIDAPFRLKQYRLAGYHKYEYAFNPETVKDPVGLFYAAASTEIDLYFRRRDDARREYDAWHAIEGEPTSLTERAPSRWTRVLQFISRGRSIRNLAIHLTQFAAQRQLRKSQLDQGARSAYSDPSLRVARELVEQELSSPVDYPIEPISGLAEMFQSNRVGELQMIVALLAALIGGAIGAATTLIAAG